MSIVFILDGSSSMYLLSESYIKGVNDLISEQKNQNPNVKFSMITFSEKIKVICLNTDLKSLPKLTREYYQPFGCTALYDAIGNSIKLKENDKDVIMIIMSDGEENCSKFFNLENIKTTIKQKKSNNWEFIYIATNQDAKKVGESMGISTCINYSESKESISKVMYACNIAIGHAIFKLTGISNQFINQEIPTDVSDLLKSLENCKI